MPNVLAEFVDPNATFEFDVTRALDALSAGGWLPGEAGVRTKNGVPARFTLHYPAGDSVSEALAQAFAANAAAIGVEVTPAPATTDLPGPSVARFGNPFDPDLDLYTAVPHSAATTTPPSTRPWRPAARRRTRRSARPRTASSSGRGWAPRAWWCWWRRTTRT
jgi:hypothetical protein